MSVKGKVNVGAIPLDSVGNDTATAVLEPPPIPDYLSSTYWWAYLHPNAVQVFEREWLVNLILWGNMRRLTEAVIVELAPESGDDILQVACVYGGFSDLLAQHIGKAKAQLHIVDIAPIQLDNARGKLRQHDHVQYHHQDASALAFSDQQFSATVLFFLLHEQPAEVRRRTLLEALRVTRPGGQVIIVDYHGPSLWNPWRYLMRPVLSWLEPFALDLWRHPLHEFLPGPIAGARIESSRYFGGLYQKAVIHLPR
jgi:ubiquinone/menaquinone biosynthesis C-methylase UbiE